MSKITIAPIQAGYRSLQAYNSNFAAIQAGFDNTISRDGTAPNQMVSALDMNNNRIINVPFPTHGTDLVRLQDLTTTPQPIGSANVRTFGCKGDGVTDDTANIILALSFVQGGGGLYFPAGTYLMSSRINTSLNNLKVSGDGPGATTLLSTTFNQGHFGFSGFNTHISGITFQSFVNQTGGGFVTLSGSGQYLYDCQFSGAMFGIVLSGSCTLTTISDVQMQGFTASAQGIFFNTTSAGPILCRNVTMIGSGTQSAGFSFEQAGDVQLDACNVIGMGTQLSAQPGTGHSIVSLYARGCYFDNGPAYSGQNGILIDALTATSVVQRFQFINCWVASMTNSGIIVRNTGAGTVRGINFHMVQVYSNIGGVSLGAGVIGFSFTNSTIAGSSGDAISVAANTISFQIVSNFIGAYDSFPNNVGKPVNIATGSSDHYIVALNMILGNTGGNSVTDGGTGSNKQVTLNVA